MALRCTWGEPLHLSDTLTLLSDSRKLQEVTKVARNTKNLTTTAVTNSSGMSMSTPEALVSIVYFDPQPNNRENTETD